LTQSNIQVIKLSKPGKSVKINSKIYTHPV